ncbi:MAG: hypothetical protein D3923_00630 [Candidatus Electrothrix sp. AR3]|nr:hypothetical protein [Candidatus Electrothrix sp. AR3]
MKRLDISCLIFSFAICFPLAVNADLLLWNKLGSTYEVQHSAAGPNGEIVGEVLFEPSQHGNGFRSAERTNNFDTPNNFVRFPLPGLGPQGSIEFWYHPDWNNSSVGHVIDLIQYGFPEPSGGAHLAFVLSYNNWTDHIIAWVLDQGTDPPDLAVEYIYPSSNPQWSTITPMHIAYTWDVSADKKLTLYLNGQPAGSNYRVEGTPDEFLWNFSEPYLYVGSRMYSGDWDRHYWEPNINGIIDNIKVWDYAKADFSDRFFEGDKNISLQAVYNLLL